MAAYDNKSIDTRLASIEGHIKGIRQMVADGKPCEEVLLQLSAVEGSVTKLAKMMLKNHLNHCVKDGVEHGEADVLERFANLLDKYI